MAKSNVRWFIVREKHCWIRDYQVARAIRVMFARRSWGASLTLRAKPAELPKHWPPCAMYVRVYNSPTSSLHAHAQNNIITLLIISLRVYKSLLLSDQSDWELHVVESNGEPSDSGVIARKLALIFLTTGAAGLACSLEVRNLQAGRPAGGAHHAFLILALWTNELPTCSKKRGIVDDVYISLKG